MTWKQKHKKNTKLIQLYFDSLQHELLDYNTKLKLAAELGKLAGQNQLILQMSVEEYNTECHDYFIEIPSTLNN